MLDPDLKLGEAYMDGTFVVERGTIADFVDLVLDRKPRLAAGTAPSLRSDTPGGGSSSSICGTRARRNVAHHYDLDGRLYSLFLDSDRQYSCAYFENRPRQSLDDAQLAKKRHLAAKLLIDRTDHLLLDIGCGWGGLALYACRILPAPRSPASRCRRSSSSRGARPRQ